MAVYDMFWRKIYDVAAASCREEHEKVLYPSSNDEILQRVLACNLLASRIRGKGKKLADIGCGPGRYFKDMQLMGYEITGCDYSWNLLRIAKTQNAGSVFQAEAEHLPFSASKFDVVISIGVLQTVVDYKKGMGELSRILKPGGVLVMSTLRSPDIWELPFFPVAEMKMFDRSILSGQWYSRLIRDRKGLNWHNRPGFFKAKRFGVSDIKKYLMRVGFTDVHRYYLGRFRNIPLLINSQIVTFAAIKKI